MKTSYIDILNCPLCVAIGAVLPADVAVHSLAEDKPQNLVSAQYQVLRAAKWSKSRIGQNNNHNGGPMDITHT